MIAVVHGPDAATARAEASALARAHDRTGESTSSLDGRRVNSRDIIAAVGSVGFFAEPRVVIVVDYLSRAAKAQLGTLAEPTENDARTTDLHLGELFAAVPANNVLILLDPTLASLPAAVRKALPPDATLIAADPPRGAALTDWLVRAARSVGADLDVSTARVIAERIYPRTWTTKPTNPAFDTPPDLDLLGNEIAKLALAADPGPITKELVTAMIAAGDDDQIFRFAEASVAGQTAIAVTELAKLLDAGEEPFKLAAQVQQQAELSIVIATAGSRADPISVGRALGLTNPNRMIGVANAQRRQPPDGVLRALQAVLSADRQIKRGRLRYPTDGLYAILAATAPADVSRSRQQGGT